MPPPLNHQQFSEIEGIKAPDWLALISQLQSLPTGREHASEYEDLIEKIFTALFYPSLCNPTKQHQIHDGRKRIDITYTNEARAGFFNWLAQHYASAFIFVECKNYGKEVGNPEMDQLAGRFSPSRGQVGILVCRSVEDANRLDARCKDAANDSRGYILAITDADVVKLIEDVRQTERAETFQLLMQKFQSLVS